MSFYTSLTGLNAATAMLGVTSNNISNVGTTGFKRSRADFGDIFATSPLQKSSSTVGQGVSLKQVSQEFSQGNISFSSNALDLAITGDGFFPLRSADGLQELFTRNGSFLLNEQFNVVNSSGQRLMAATVDSTGSANVNERVVLTIPQTTSGEAKQTSLVQLGLNFPADAQVITETFNRSNPATYNKSTAFTVYDNGGNGYLATIYYVKTANANQNVPFNKWQTHVFVGEDSVEASLVQATDSNSEKLYVNQYGQIKPYSVVKDELTTAKTQLFSLDELTDKRTSVPASVSGASLLSSALDFTNGINFSTTTNTTLNAANALSSLFTIDVDGSGNPVTLDMSHLKTVNASLTGSQIAAEATAVLNRKFGDEAYFDFSAAGANIFNISSSRISSTATTPVTITLAANSNGITDLSKVTINQAVAAIQAQIDASALKVTTAGSTFGNVTVSYDYA
ncbi:MAG: flagellar hook-basal body complex protein, partial [Limnohabitans sp.]